MTAERRCAIDVESSWLDRDVADISGRRQNPFTAVLNHLWIHKPFLSTALQPSKSIAGIRATSFILRAILVL